MRPRSFRNVSCHDTRRAPPSKTPSHGNKNPPKDKQAGSCRGDIVRRAKGAWTPADSAPRPTFERREADLPANRKSACSREAKALDGLSARRRAVLRDLPLEKDSKSNRRGTRQ